MISQTYFKDYIIQSGLNRTCQTSSQCLINVNFLSFPLLDVKSLPLLHLYYLWDLKIWEEGCSLPKQMHHQELQAHLAHVKFCAMSQE